MPEITEERIKEIIKAYLIERGLLNEDILTKVKKDRYGTSVLLTKDEYAKLCSRFSKEGADGRIERLDHYIGSKGRKYKSHYMTILSWEDKKGGQYEKVDIKTLFK